MRRRRGDCCPEPNIDEHGETAAGAEQGGGASRRRRDVLRAHAELPNALRRARTRESARTSSI